MHHLQEVGADVAMCFGPDGVVVDEVHEAVSIAVQRSADGCSIEQMCAADLRCVDFLEDVFACRSFDDAQDVPNFIDVQRLY